MTLPAGSSSVPGPSDTTGLPHTRARSGHWLATAAVLTAVTWAATLVQPADATVTAQLPPTGPDPAEAEFPLDCGPVGLLVTDQAAVDLDADGRAETVAVVRCDAGSGTPPSGMYVLTHASEDGGARVAETLVDPAERMTVQELEADGGTVTVLLLGYSSPDVPRCCPDLRREVSWGWRDGRLELRAAPAPGSV